MRKGRIRRIFQLEKGAILTSKTSTYRLKKIMGYGAFGLVVKCIKQETGETVAIKISRRHTRHYCQKEGKELKEIKRLGSEDYNIVQFYEEFSYRGQWCLVFELLDITLEDFTRIVVCGGLKLFDIRVITEQLLVALTFLKRSKKAHRDIKPDNVMVQDRKKLKVKLIDFSFLTSVRQMRNVVCCPQIYKSPEDHLNVDVDESVDMWNLGCTLAFLYLGDHLIDGEDDYETWLNIVTLVGHPEEDLLDRADTPFHFYTKIDSEGEQHWELRKDLLDLMNALNNKPSLVSPSPDLLERKIKSLDDIENLRPGKMTPDERKDLLCFIDLLKQMLVLDPLKRITPNEALKHPFITMEHFPVCESNSPYVCEAREKMAIYKLPEGETLGESSATCPKSKTTTSDGVSPSGSSDSSSENSVITTPPSWISRFNVVRRKKGRNYKSPANGMYLMTTIPRRVYSDSLSSKTSSDGVYPASSSTTSSAFNGVSSASLKSEASTQQTADQNEKLLTSSLKKTSTMTDTTNTKEMTTKRICKHPASASESF
ncbi:serine/threonine-protein kinase ppk15-like [Girardinichthys multiradiatus]|uniref:serine/threonine-protein kinase ppk15-like n=1 Tax=Girardinichthys multiradiatus TaxID=208333 RepID=UPI001FAC5FB8|nr:serine/threonine-protein kinase ppk15-like [Girardinichthys multiradiatus]